MDTRVSPDGLTIWEELVQEEDRTGEIPLPAVETVSLRHGRSASIVIIDPQVMQQTASVIVDIQAIEQDRIDFAYVLALLQALEREARPNGQKGDLVAIFHEGGYGYEFRWATKSNRGSGWGAVSTRSLPGETQFEIWGMLRALALRAVNYPDRKASLAKTR
jgi:hypothetical protein